MEIKSLEEINRSFMPEAVFERKGSEVRGQGAGDERAEIVFFDSVNVSSAATKPIEPMGFMETAVSVENSEVRTAARKRGAYAIISGVLISLAILLVLFSALTSSSYAFFTVLTSSMHDEIPKGSLILTHKVDPQDLKAGDNITFMRDWRTSVTHKIMNIYENYQNDGARGFRTKGVNNASPDEEIVHEDYIVGKVVLSIPAIGAAMSYLGENIYIVLIIFGLCLALSAMLSIKRKQVPRNSG